MSYKYTCIGRIPSNWNIFSLKECTTKITDGTHSTVKDNPEGEYFLLSCKNIKSGKIVLGEKERKIDYQTLSKLRTRTGLSKDDILLTTVGTIGESSIIKDENIDYEFQRSVAIIRPNKEILLPKFLYYTTKSNRFKGQALGMVSGSVQKCLFLGAIGDIKVPIPSLEEQEKIVNILSSLDDKIELNNEMNKTLEEMAQSIFKRWFVDFEFPNEDGEPYKSSGGEMVDSELGMIPKGWEVSCLYNLAEYINGTSFKSKDYSENGIPIIKIAELKNGITDGTKYFVGDKDKKFYLKNRDILFSWSGNPDTSIDTFIWNKGDAILNQHIFKVIPKIEDGYAFTYLMLKYLKSTFTHIARNKQTTGLGHVTVKDLKELNIAVNYDQVKEFNKLVEPMIDKIIENNNDIEYINIMRDSLLPKLMSGEISLSE